MVLDRLNDVYAESMKNHPYGYAMYEPESALLLKPATCGYLTETGSWTPLVDLGDEDKMTSLGLTPFTKLERAPPRSSEWGPRIASDMDHVNIDLKAQASLIPSGIPANVEAVIAFSNRKDSGAVLLTKGDVIRESVYHREPYRLWLRANAAKLLQLWPDTRDRGIWIVTETWSAPRVSLNAWKNTKKTVMVGFDVAFTPIGEIGPSTSWHTGTKDSGWVKPKTSNPVIFVGGIYFRYRKLARGLKEYRFRGEEEFKIKDPDEEESELVVDVEEFGEEELSAHAEDPDDEDDF